MRLARPYRAVCGVEFVVMTVSEIARQRLEALQRRAGPDCVGFRFEGAIGSCRVSKPILVPVTAPVPVVVRSRRASWRITSSPSADSRTSNSTISAPISMALLKANSVFSGY